MNTDNTIVAGSTGWSSRVKEKVREATLEVNSALDAGTAAKEETQMLETVQFELNRILRLICPIDAYERLVVLPESMLATDSGVVNVWKVRRLQRALQLVSIMAEDLREESRGLALGGRTSMSQMMGARLLHRFMDVENSLKGSYARLTSEFGDIPDGNTSPADFLSDTQKDVDA